MLYGVIWPVDTVSGPQRPVGYSIRIFWQAKHDTSVHLTETPHATFSLRYSCM